MGANGLTPGSWGTTNYSLGATVLFVTPDHESKVYVTSFYIYWGSIESLSGTVGTTCLP
jgi:hypothetical protein